MKNKLFLCILLFIVGCEKQDEYNRSQKILNSLTFVKFKEKCWAVSDPSQWMNGFVIVPDELCDQLVEKQ